MKTYDHEWDDVRFSLHLEFDHLDGPKGPVVVRRQPATAELQDEDLVVPCCSNTLRVMMSRRHPTEKSITVSYPDGIRLSVFVLEDRAYYPAVPSFVG